MNTPRALLLAVAFAFPLPALAQPAQAPSAPSPAPATPATAASPASEAATLALVPAEFSAAIKSALEAAGDKRSEWLAAIAEVPAEQRADLCFVLAYMPANDLHRLTKDFLLNDIKLAHDAVAAVPWGKDIPQEVYRNAILPYASLNERREDWRSDFVKRVTPMIQGCKTPGEAALAINKALFPAVEVQYHPTKRPKPDQAPSESMSAHYASCSGLSILLVDACRAVGVPARIVGTPLWVVPKGDANGNHAGNHTWVEIWDGQWHTLGACEVSPLDQTWFLDNASRANEKPDDPIHHIYASSWEKKDQFFHLVWAENIHWVNAENVTATYADRRPVKVAVTSGGSPAKAHVVLRQGKLLIADLPIDNAAMLVLSGGQSYDATITPLAPTDGKAMTKKITVPADKAQSVTIELKS